jgi:hypothetical protein
MRRMENKLQDMLQAAMARLREGKIEEALSLFSKARKEIIKQFSSKALTPEAYDLLINMFILTYMGMLHYSAIGQKTATMKDETANLVCKSEALGISNIIDGIFLPLLMLDESKARQRVLTLIHLSETYREDLSKEIVQLVNSINNNQGQERTKYIDSMKQIVESVDPGLEEIRTLALQLGRRFEAGNFKQARKIYEYVRDEIHYMPDPLPFEDIQSPKITLGRLTGDCNDQAVLLCSLLLAIGFETALFFADTDGDNIADHVYSAVHIPDAPELYKPFVNKKIAEENLHDWIPLDSTCEDLDFGVLTFENLEIKHACFFTKSGKHFVNK